MSIFMRLATLSVVGFAAMLVFAAASVATAPVTPQPGPKPIVDRYGDPLPAGAIARLGTARYRCEGMVLGFLPDSKTLVTAPKPRYAGQNKLQFWDAASGVLTREFGLENVYSSSIALSPNGKLVAFPTLMPGKDPKSKDADIQVWDIASGKMIQSSKRREHDVLYCSLAFSSDSKLLASFTFDDGMVRIEAVATGVEMRRHPFPRDNGPSITFSPDGKKLAISTGSNTRKLFLWNWQAGDEPLELNVPDRVGNSLSFSPDGKMLLECGRFEFILRVWDTETGKIIRNLTPSSKGHYCYDATFTPDAKSVIASTRQNAQSAVDQWDVATWQHKSCWDSFELEGIVVSPDGKFLAGTGGGFHVWDLVAKKELSPTEGVHQGGLGLLATHGDVVATVASDFSVRMWDATNGRQQTTLPHPARIRGLAYSPDGTKLATSSFDNAVNLWDAATGKQSYKLVGHGKSGGRWPLSFTPDGKFILSWGDDNYLRKWEVATGKAMFEHQINPDGKKNAGEPIDDPREKLLARSLVGQSTFSPDGKYLLLEVRPLHLSFFEVETGALRFRLPIAAANGGALAFSPDSRMLVVSARGDGTTVVLPDGSKKHVAAKDHPLHLWELASQSRRLKATIPGIEAGPLAFSPDGKMFAAGGTESPASIYLWDATSGKELPLLTGFRSVPRSLAFSSDSKRLISGMDDSTALVWDLKLNR